MYQAAHDLTRPLEGLSKVEQRAVLTDIARKIKTAVQCTITNIRNGEEFCEHCAQAVCPTFDKHAVLSVEEAQWLRAQGVDPGTSDIEKFVRKLKDS
jgi:hypothetical protein